MNGQADPLNLDTLQSNLADMKNGDARVYLNGDKHIIITRADDGSYRYGVNTKEGQFNSRDTYKTPKDLSEEIARITSDNVVAPSVPSAENVTENTVNNAEVSAQVAENLKEVQKTALKLIAT